MPSNAGINRNSLVRNCCPFSEETSQSRNSFASSFTLDFLLITQFVGTPTASLSIAAASSLIAIGITPISVLGSTFVTSA
ncbi:hypothetical protein D3C81_2215320 [compost metagenome]